MVARAVPIKVPEVWPVVRPGVVAAASRLTSSPEKVAAEILKRLCAGAMQLWLLGSVEHEDYRGFAITELSTDLITEQKILHIYMLHMYREATQEIVTEGREAFNTFAKAHGCSWITFMADEVRMVAAAERWWPGWEVRPMARRSVE